MQVRRVRWIDVTRTIEPGMPGYPGDPKPEVVTSRDELGITITKLTMLTHAGTHLDLPQHVDERFESPSEEQILRALNGKAFVVRPRRSSGTLITLDVLHHELQGRLPRRLLIRSDPSGEGYRGLAPEAARWLSGRILLLGTDALSIDPFGEDLVAHRILLGSGTLLLENLFLAKTLAGPYHLMALPMRLGAPDGAPVRALIRPVQSQALRGRP